MGESLALMLLCLNGRQERREEFKEILLVAAVVSSRGLSDALNSGVLRAVAIEGRSKSGREVGV